MKRILIIDDDYDIRTVVKVALEKFCGWQVSTAESGAEGLALASVNYLDAILLDVSMPDMDGFSVFEQLQANFTTRSIPVILLTAKVLPSDRRRFAEMKIAGVITKPFNPVTLCNQIAELLKWDI
ncbi:response regulator with CheY-like receiver domain and winged-helix DNA-binding domain [Leptolyngbyaceae cyanobacterium JSC-12]|nr:response regulator with CheY-like receiver domain and winged-helix DNA-binding domain [Leptolyngbyaceae cyanobacterium JSC-12]